MFKFYESTRTKHSGRTTTNIYLQLKWDLMNYENHKFNVEHAKPLLDNQAPRTFSHLYYRPKKLQLELERFAKIQRGNKSLMRRIATIHREGAWIDNKNFYEIKSLNTWKRQQEMTDLCYDNQVMVTRILDVRAVHNASKYEDEFLEFQKHKVNVQRYSKDWRHGVLQMKLMQKHIRAMVKAYRSGKYKPEMRNRIEKLALKKEATEQMRREKEAEAQKEAEEQRRAKHLADAKLAKEQKREEEQRKTHTKDWREARAERLHRIEEQREEKEKQLTAEKKRQEEARKQRTTVAKEKVKQWKTLHEEEEQRELEKKRSEERRKKAEEQAKARAAQEKKKKRLAQWKEKKMGKSSSGTDSLKEESSAESVVSSILDYLEEQEEGIPREQQEEDILQEQGEDVPRDQGVDVFPEDIRREQKEYIPEELEEDTPREQEEDIPEERGGDIPRDQEEVIPEEQGEDTPREQEEPEEDIPEERGWETTDEEDARLGEGRSGEHPEESEDERR